METDVLSPSAVGQASALPPATGSSKLNVGTGERIASVIGGTALAIYSLRNFKSTNSKLLGVAALLLLKRGVSGYCEINNAIGRNTAEKSAKAMEVKATFTINKPREEVYAFWRKLENLPSFMKHLEKVVVKDAQTSTWTAKIPGGLATVSWDAVIQEEDTNNFLSWSSLPGSKVDNAGEIRFIDAPRNEGTEIHATISYRLPAGDVGGVAGKLFNPLVERMIKHDLRRFKSLLETGEIATKESSKKKSTDALNYLVE